MQDLTWNNLTGKEQEYFFEKAQWYHDNNLFDTVPLVDLAEKLYYINLEANGNVEHSTVE